MSQIPQPQKQTFLVVDDHALVLDGTLSILKQAYPAVDILTAQTAQEALNQMEQTYSDLVIVGLVMPDAIGETRYWRCKYVSLLASQ